MATDPSELHDKAAAAKHCLTHACKDSGGGWICLSVECILDLAGACAVHGSGPLSSMFSAAPYDPSGFFPGPQFGRFGVTKNRALIVLRAAHLSLGPE